MNLEFPYQLVAFLENEPKVDEPAYYGEHGWYPQIALKRRFKAADISEEELIDKLAEFCASTEPFKIEVGGLIQPDRMPVKVLEVKPTPELMAFHNDFIAYMGGAIVSRYPDRDGANYMPHITAEYNGKTVIDTQKLSHREYEIDKIFLLKDIADENSVVYKSFVLK